MDNEVSKGVLASGTRSTYGGILNRIASAVGAASVASISKVDINQMLSALTSSAATHNNMLKAMRAMFKFAQEETHLINDDPTMGVKYVSDNTDGHSEWTRDQLMQFLRHHPKGTTAHLAVTILLYTACRRSDVVKLGPNNLKVKNGRHCLEFRQTKGEGGTGSLVIVPIDKHFLGVLNATKTGTDTFLINEYGRPFSVKGFGERMRKWIRKADLPTGITTHGIRKSIGSMMAEADCSNYQIMAMQGHSSPKASEKYTRRARRRVLAEQGREKTDLNGILGKPQVVK